MIDISYEERFLHLHAVLSTNYRAFVRLLEWDPGLVSIYKASASEISEILQLNDRQSKRLFEWLRRSDQAVYKEQLDKAGIQTIFRHSSNYPPLLNTIYDPPHILYTKGNLEILKTKKIAVVGTRTPTSYSKEVLALLTPVIIDAGITIVSGLARGVDSLAHHSAITYKGLTIAITACGFDTVYPPEHYSLFQSIASHHLVVSEYPPFVKPKKWHFPARNRLISGMSYATIIIEAKRKSGSLITADLAIEQGREVFAVPSNITSSESSGTNWLISQGACCLYSKNTLSETLPNFLSKDSEPSDFI